MSRHVAIYTDDPDKGGVANYNQQIALGLRRAGWQVSIVQSASAIPAIRQQAEAGINHEWISYDTGVDFVRTITDTKDAERAFAQLRPDVILFSDCCPVSNLAAKHVAIRQRIPFFIVVHFVAQYLADRFATCLPVLARQYMQAQGVAAVSTENLTLLRRSFGLPSTQGIVMFNGVGEEFFTSRNEARSAEWRKKYHIPPDAIVSLTAARLAEVKGHVIQLHALELLRARDRKSRLVCVWAGGGELREALAADIARRNLSDCVYMVGQQSDMAPWLDVADIFTLTSMMEGMPISIMEAMARGLPVAATSISGIPEELGDTGALLPDPQRDAPGAVTQLANTWAAWSRSAEVRMQVGAAGRLRAAQHFRADSMLQRVSEVLERAIPALAVSERAV